MQQASFNDVDPLSDLLRIVRLDGAHFYPVEATAPWSIVTPPSLELSPRVLPRAEHLIPYHFLIEGSCWAGEMGTEQVEMRPGDVVIFPHGAAHLMSSGPGVRERPDTMEVSPPGFPITQYLGPDGPRTAKFMCGFLGCDLRPFNPLLASLPSRMHMPGFGQTGFGEFARKLAIDSSTGIAGAESVLTRLAELMFIAVVRQYLDTLPAGRVGWLAGLRDEVVGRALSLIHARPAHPWTLAELARESASSRTALSKRFTEIVGQPPRQYLTRWRLQVAADLLAQGSAKVATIGNEVGYDSEAAFSRAFKKATGQAPGAWRDLRRSRPIR